MQRTLEFLRLLLDAGRVPMGASGLINSWNGKRNGFVPHAI